MSAAESEIKTGNQTLKAGSWRFTKNFSISCEKIAVLKSQYFRHHSKIDVIT